MTQTTTTAPEPSRARLYDGETFEHNGLTFRVDFKPDTDHEPPWESDCGRGPVSEWTTRDKRPGERVLAVDHGHKRYYDYATAIKLARKDGWDTPPYQTGKPGERAARAVEADFKFLQDWCEDRWHYLGVIVTLLDTDGEDTRESESLWGVESCANDYLTEVAYELAGEIASRVGDSDRVCQVVRK